MGSLPAEFKKMAIAEDGVRAVGMSAEEKIAGRYSPLTLQKALEAMNRDGLVLLKGVVDTKHVEALNGRMCLDAEKKRVDPNQIFNHDIKSNFLQRPPIDDPQYLFEDIYFNSFLLQLANAYLGHKPIWNWLTANTALANTNGMRQPAHKDCAFVHPEYPYYFIANIPLCTFSIANGATEFWLGSHAQATWQEQVIAEHPSQIEQYGRLGEPLPSITEAAKEARMKIRPPIQPACEPGDIMIRDLRLWHAGMPNSTDEHRIMLGLGYQSPVYPNYTMRTHLPLSQQAFFLSKAKDLVEVRANFYDDAEFDTLTKDTDFELRPDYMH